MSRSKSGSFKYVLTEEQRGMYAAEKLENFRWISKLVATPSSYTITDADLVSDDIYNELAELGQFAEVAYSSTPIARLIEDYATLSQPPYPLENYNALRDCILVDTFLGKFADLPAYIAFRPSTQQLVVSISGTSSIQHAYQDLRAMRVAHPSGQGGVHAGFWDLYQGIREMLLTGMWKGFEQYSPAEIVLTGHSMGGSVSYLLSMDLLADRDAWRPNLALRIAAFGAPRSGDAKLVAHFRSLVDTFRKTWGDESFHEYSVKGYNDGVPALPPAFLGYRHFCKEPFYTVCGQLYRTPTSECEHSLFHVQREPDDSETRPFPKGGHNYYNGRDLERFARRVGWLEEANLVKAGWEARYTAIAMKNR